MYLNKALIQQLLSKKPDSINNKILFITDNKKRAEVIGMTDYKCILLEPKDNEHYHDVETFIDYLNKATYTGQCRNDYIYLQTCLTKNANDKLKNYFEEENLKNYPGWNLFYKNKSLDNLENTENLKAAIEDFINAYEGTPQDEKRLFKLQFHHTDKNGNPIRVFDYKIFKYILKNYHIFVCGGAAYLYQYGVYREDERGTKIKKIIRSLILEEFITTRTINAIYNLILDADELQKKFEDLNNYPKTYINFMDCMLDVKTMNKINHDPKYFAINQVPFNYDDIKNSVKSEAIEDYFNFIFTNEDDRRMVLEHSGLGLTKDTSFQHFLIIHGKDGSGKSILIRLMETAAGRENVSNVALQDLSKRFSTSLLLGKTLNTCADLSVEAIQDSSTIKKLTGEDYIMAERKGQDAFMFKSYAHFTFSTNELPVVNAERSNGFFRRLLIFDINKKPEKEEIGLFDRLVKDIHYFIRLAVEALHEMYTRGNITISENSKKMVAQMRKDSDVVQAWIDDRCTIGNDLKIERIAAFEDFIDFCKVEERQPLTKNRFFKTLREKNFSEVRGKTERYFGGLSGGKMTVKSDGNDEFMTLTEEQQKNLPF